MEVGEGEKKMPDAAQSACLGMRSKASLAGRGILTDKAEPFPKFAVIETTDLAILPGQPSDQLLGQMFRPAEENLSRILDQSAKEGVDASCVVSVGVSKKDRIG